jgi:surface polysaccharide O-acyltransferase-like enzyme
MWFLFLIVGLYLVTPLMRKISADRGMLNYFLVLSLFFGFLIPTLRHQVIPFSVALAESDTIHALLKDYDSMRIYLPLGYTGYFALGWYLYKRNLTPGERIVIYVLGVAGFLLTITGTAVLSRNLAKANSAWYEYVSLNVLLESMAVFVLVRYSSRYWKEKARNLLTAMADKTFGIYLIHLLLVEFLADIIGLKSTLFTPVLSVPLLAALTFAVSYFAAKGLKRLGRFSRYIL